MTGIAQIAAGRSFVGSGKIGGMADVKAGESFAGSGVGGGIANVRAGTSFQAMNGAYVLVGTAFAGSGQGTVTNQGADLVVGDAFEGSGFGGGFAFVQAGVSPQGSGVGQQLPNGRADVQAGSSFIGSGEGFITPQGVAIIQAGLSFQGGGLVGGIANVRAGDSPIGTGQGTVAIPGAADLLVGTFPVGSGAGELGPISGKAELLVGTFIRGGSGNQGIATVFAGDSFRGSGRGVLSGGAVDAFRGYGMNLTNRAFWELDATACSFFEMGRFAGMILALIPGVGIVRLGPRTAQGAAIDASMKLGNMDIKEEHLKRNTHALVTWRGDTDMQISTVHDEKPHRDYIIRGQHGFTDLRTRRVKLAQGPKSKFVAYRFHNVAGGRFDLHHIELAIEVLERRLP